LGDGEDKSKGPNLYSKPIEVLEGDGVTKCLHEVPWVVSFQSFDTRQPKYQMMEETYDKKDHATLSSKSTKSPSSIKIFFFDNMIFGTWGLDDDIKDLGSLNDFLPNLSRIKNPNPPPLIHIPMIEEGQLNGTSQMGSSANLSIYTKDIEPHKDTPSKETSKYNLRSRRKGTIDFLGKVTGGLGFLL